MQDIYLYIRRDFYHIYTNSKETIFIYCDIFYEKIYKIGQYICILFDTTTRFMTDIAMEYMTRVPQVVHGFTFEIDQNDLILNDRVYHYVSTDRVERNFFTNKYQNE